MGKKVVWLLVSCLMMAVLVLVSCAPAAVEEEQEVVTPEEKEEEVVTPEEETAPPVEEEEAVPPEEEVPAPSGEAPITEGESQAVALDYLLSSSTFKFDGMEDTVRLVSRAAQEEPYSWQFDYEFQSRHAGYGDRTGLILAQVITSHRARIVVRQGEVVDAVLDGKWDMLRQKMIQ